MQFQALVSKKANMWRAVKVLLFSTGDSAQCYVAAWMGGELGGEWTHVYGWLNLSAVHLKLTILLISYTSTQNKKFFFFFKANANEFSSYTYTKSI